MSYFTTDAALLAYEPTVFADLAFFGQQVLHVTDAMLAGSTVTSVTGGLDALAAGQVAVLRSTPADAAAFAIATVTDAHSLALATAPSHLPTDAALTLIVRTLSSQRALVHGQLLRDLGIEPNDPDETLDASAILSTDVAAGLECLGTLALAYESAQRPGDDNQPIALQAAAYRQRFTHAMRSARVLIDLDGDGRADVWRTPGMGRLVRA